MSNTGLFNRLQKLEGPREGTRIVCVALDAQGGQRFLWQLPCSRPSQVLRIEIPPGGVDPVFTVEDIDDGTT